jgi:hypothetical protein
MKKFTRERQKNVFNAQSAAFLYEINHSPLAYEMIEARSNDDVHN